MILKKIKNTIESIENQKYPIIYYIFSFFIVINIRCFLEVFSSSLELNILQYTHFVSFYYSIVLTFVVLAYFVIRSNIEKILKISFIFASIIIIPPLIDLLVCSNETCFIAYLTVKADVSDYSMLFRFFTLGGEYRQAGGITPGIKVEFILILIGIFIFFFVKSRKFIRSFLFTFVFYVVLFIHYISPIWFSGFLKIFGKDVYSNFDYNFANLFILFVLLQLVVVFYIYNKKIFFAIFKEMPWLRIAYFQLLVPLGIFIASSNLDSRSNKLSSIFQYDLLNSFPFPFLTFVVVFLFACLFVIVNNNIADYEIDKISNPGRALVGGYVALDQYRMIGNASLTLFILSAPVLGFPVFLLLVIFVGNYFVYSTHPFRLKRLTILSKLPIAINSLALLFIGYIWGFKLINGNVFDIVRTFPARIIYFVLVCLSLSINFIDIKDYKGDKNAGIKTLPVVFGLRISKIIIGGFFLVTYILTYFVFELDVLPYLLLLIIGLTQFFLINKKEYKERPIFLLILFSVIIVLFNEIYVISI